MATHTAKRPRLAVLSPNTPRPGSDNTDDALFHKLPAALTAPATPSTSTVAFSSSPRRHNALASSSPTRHARFAPYSDASTCAPADHELTLQTGTSFIFGRHHVRNASVKKKSVSIESVIPRRLAHLVGNPENAVETITLPREAHHASRVHALVELVLPLSQNRDKILRVLVVGQNGMRIKAPRGMSPTPGKNGRKGVKLVQGQRFEVALARGQVVELNFGKVKVAVKMEGDVEPAYSSPVRAPRLSSALPSSLPPSSPPIVNVDLDDEVDVSPRERTSLESSPEPPLFPRSSPLPTTTTKPTFTLPSSRESSPLSPVSQRSNLSPAPEPSSPAQMSSPALPSSPYHDDYDSHEDNDELEGEGEGEGDAVDVKAERLEGLHAPSRKNSPSGLARASTTPVETRPPPADVDLPAIIASTVVFSGISKLSLPDLVRHMLESQGHLKDQGDEKQWTIWVEDVLEDNPMFGKVERSGKDSSGHPLLPHYFYNPSADPDAERAANFGNFARPLRKAARSAAAIDWRPVGARRRKAW
ncbi:hypothetical protein L198_05911 [Cryptococcus wingfieldii CBS 7118]|uniref:FHA domain-containing protein n=1 Tax=Cryptococcus wingfieldii CBS 7118 TaxID=1295528 RepID=A0A1E3IS07_9TREE|nr:hypothetical protein L198_05911 [Cryptococcus wingfieldii CBS 7118]ODN91397.1 hypothetical protein L198_05911 [Cryptococcus wingfieldii CBS 7118]